MNRSLNVLLLGALVAFPALAAPNPSPDAKVAKSKVAHIMTIKVTGMS